MTTGLVRTSHQRSGAGRWLAPKLDPIVGQVSGIGPALCAYTRIPCADALKPSCADAPAGQDKYRWLAWKVVADTGAVEIMPSTPSLRNHPTWIATQKVRAAQHTLVELSDAWSGHLAARHVTLDEQRDRSEGTLSFVVRIPDPGAVAGLEILLRSCVSDGRSALSNLVHALARQAGASSAELLSSDFPIVSVERDWKRALARKLKGLPEDVVDRIKHVQPWSQSLSGPRWHPLTALQELNNADKHREGLWIAPELGSDRQVHLVSEVRYEIPAGRSTEEAERLSDPDSVIDVNPHPLQDGETVLRMRFPEWVDVKHGVDLGKTELPMKLTLMAPGGSPDGYPLLWELAEALEFTRSTIRYVAGLAAQAPTPKPRTVVAN